MADQETAPQCRPGSVNVGQEDTATAADNSAPSAPEDFEFRILSSGGLATAGEDAADMCVADEVFSDGKLLPFRLSSADASGALLLLCSDSTAASSTGLGSRSDSWSASSSSSSGISSGCVSRSPSSKSASSDAVEPPRRSLPSSVFYAHPSPSPRPPRRGGPAGAASAARRSTGSAPPAAWGIIRLGVVGAPDVYPPRSAEAKKAAAARGRCRSARFEPASVPKPVAMEKKLALGLLGGGLGCSCSPDAVEPMSSMEAAAAAEARRRKKGNEKKAATTGAKRDQSTVRRSRILAWLDELSIAKDKN